MQCVIFEILQPVVRVLYAHELLKQSCVQKHTMFSMHCFLIWNSSINHGQALSISFHAVCAWIKVSRCMLIYTGDFKLVIFVSDTEDITSDFF